MPTPPTRRTVLGVMAAAAAAPSTLALSSPAAALPSPASARTGAAALPGGGDLGPNVLIFDPSTPDIQGTLDRIFRQQESAQFGGGRYQLLFKPGTYNNLNAQIGFYTSISGLGLSPDDTTFNGDVTVDAGWFDGNATQNFWRSAENLALNPVNGTNRWAVAQAAPFRRMHVKGGLNLAPDGYGWASGGYIADSRIDGTVGPYSQQQWYTRDSSVGGWTNGVWNMVFSGVEGAPAQSFPDPPYTTLDTTPVSREKPFLYLDGADYQVFLPRTAHQRARRHLGERHAAGDLGPAHPVLRRQARRDRRHPQRGARPGPQPAVHARRSTTSTSPSRSNRAEHGGPRASVTPRSSRTTASTAMKVADVDGVRLAGFLIDAGTGQLPDPAGGRPARRVHATTPPTRPPSRTSSSGSAARAPARPPPAWSINSRHTIIDHTWVWRADHGDGRRLGDQPRGLRRRRERRRRAGDRPVRRALQQVRRAVERPARPHDLLPEREGLRRPRTRPRSRTAVPGATPPTRSPTPSPRTRAGAWAATATTTSTRRSVQAPRLRRARTAPGVKFHDLLVVSLGGNGQYDHVINAVGSPTLGTTTVPSTVVSYP